MNVEVKKVEKDRWTATYQGVVGEGKGPLSAARDLLAKIQRPGRPPAKGS